MNKNIWRNVGGYFTRSFALLNTQKNREGEHCIEEEISISFVALLHYLGSLMKQKRENWNIFSISNFNQIPNSLLRRHLPFQEPRKLFGKYILSTILYLLDMFSHFPAPTNTFHFKNNYAWLCEREDAHVLRKYVRRRFIWRNSGIIHMFLFFFFVLSIIYAMLQWYGGHVWFILQCSLFY